MSESKYLVIQDKENGDLFAGMKCWTENGVKRFQRCTPFSADRSFVEALIGPKAER